MIPAVGRKHIKQKFHDKSDEVEQDRAVLHLMMITAVKRQ